MSQMQDKIKNQTENIKALEQTHLGLQQQFGEVSVKHNS